MLRLLDDVSWQGHAVTSERSQALLAALVGAAGRSVSEAALVAAVWGPDGEPANAAKALQVVVSRTRTQLGAHVVLRADGGYRLELAATDVDAYQHGLCVRDATRAEAVGDLMIAAEQARRALAVAIATDATAPAVLAELRAHAGDEQAIARGVLGRAASGLGDHPEALALLTALADPDEATLAALLRSESAVHGAPTALAHYERHRSEVRERLGVDPGPVLQAVHAELLAADNPVRTGLGYDATSLIGRDDDVRRLRALVRESRVTSILGPGGLGKTRLARLLGREAEQPVVHFVELVGVVSPEDVVSEVGSAIGVRDSISGRKVLSSEQLADVRGRIAQQLDQAPTLLILDNCEHVVEAVADLVAPLVATTRQLRVVTTTRAPLGIAAERVFALGQLAEDAAVELFGQRARAARPDVRLETEAVRRVVARLDGLPLAIELAAAKVRAMSVDDIDRRLLDRFALLRGTDRGAPDRHQTLLAVIDWSWALLGEAERRALRRLSVFPDGFALDAAEEVLGPDALGSVESLVGQSLLTVRESATGLRYRMLETVREFGGLRLRDDGAGDADGDGARSAVRRWSVGFCRQRLPELYGPRQIATVRELGVEENNLADSLRECLADADGESAVVLLAALGGFWTIRGEHPRILLLLDPVEDLLEHWAPSYADRDAAARAAGVLVLNTAIAGLPNRVRVRTLLEQYGAESADPGTRALQAVLETVGEVLPGHNAPALDLLTASPDRLVAMLALEWKSHYLENQGEPEASIAAAELSRALWRPEDGVWNKALLDTHLAGLHAQRGRLEQARRFAESGLDVLDALEAHDDGIQLRAMMAAAALAEGDIDRAEALVDEMTSISNPGLWGAIIVLGVTRAEVAMARGRTSEALAIYDRAVVQVRGLRFPGIVIESGIEPWTLFVESVTTAAHAWHGDAGAADRTLRDQVAAKLPVVIAHDQAEIDYPVAGCMLFALGIWSMFRDDDPRAGIECLALAHRFGYNLLSPSMSWDRVVAAAERSAPGLLQQLLDGYDERRGADLLQEARAAAMGVG